MDKLLFCLSAILCLQTWLSSPLGKSLAVASTVYLNQAVPYAEGSDLAAPYASSRDLVGPAYSYEGGQKRQVQQYAGGPAFGDQGTEKRRLRFVRRGVPVDDSVFYVPAAASYIPQRQLRGPRLRFQKREAVLEEDIKQQGIINAADRRGSHALHQKQSSQDDLAGVAENELEMQLSGNPANSGRDVLTSTSSSSAGKPSKQLHARKRRSTRFHSTSLHKRLSISNDLDAIRSMVLNSERRRRLEELNNLKQMLLRKGKRSGESSSIDLDEGGSDSSEETVDEQAREAIDRLLALVDKPKMAGHKCEDCIL